ncbi:MAG: radical SAM protein [Coriobacteriia bacterium]|jgi:23S rRNA (adenine2503-C2)-methyltransferase|nr:radical SAM protein [Coriobacteriia bacterium]
MRINVSTSPYGFEIEEFTKLLGSESDAISLFKSLYVDRSPAGDDVLVHLGNSVAPRLRAVSIEQGRMSSKYLFELDDASGAAIEAVRIKRRTGMTACVSTQAGCAVGCSFCASGANGLDRNLSAGEIVEQVMALGPEVNRVVYMGVGEPLMNLEAVLKSMRILRDREGLALPTSGMTISTIGGPAGLKRLREVHMKFNLTISLHATRDDVRHRLMPGTSRHHIEDVVAAAKDWSSRHNRPVTYAYLVFPGLNDSRSDVRRLTKWFAGGSGRVNLMRWNPVRERTPLPVARDSDLHRMREALVLGGVEAGVRDTQGLDVHGACGQLRLRHAPSDQR